METQINSATPKIEFRMSEEKIEEQPRFSSIVVQKMIEVLGVEQIADNLNMEKHHGVSINDIMFVLLLYASYGVTSITQLIDKSKADKALSSIIEDVKKINNKVLHYFQKKNELSTYEELLDGIIAAGQKIGRFKSKKDGVLIFDDSLLTKTGKKMDNIEVLFDHVEKRYVLGYVLVALSYADDKKSYCVNFKFRFSSDEDKKKAAQQKLKKSKAIDLRKKGSLIKWVNAKLDNGFEISQTDVSGVNLNAETLHQLDEKGIQWLGLPSSKTILLDSKQNRLDFELLKKKVLKTTPVILEITGQKIYKKPTFLLDYGKVIFCAVKDSQDNEQGYFLLKKEVDSSMSLLQDFFERQKPADNNKLNIVLELLQRGKNADIQATTAVGDSWYFVAWFIEKVLMIPGIKRVVSKVKSNIEIVYKGKKIKAKDLWEEEIPLEHISGRTMKAGCVVVTINGFKNPLKLVLVQEFDKCGRPKARYILVCTDTNYSKEKIIRAYKLRWSIECFFRTAKQRFGLDQFHVRKLNKIHSHVTFSFISYLLIACIKHLNPKLKDLTYGQIIDEYCNSLVKLERKFKTIVLYVYSAFIEKFGEPGDIF